MALTDAAAGFQATEFVRLKECQVLADCDRSSALRAAAGLAAQLVGGCQAGRPCERQRLRPKDAHPDVLLRRSSLEGNASNLSIDSVNLFGAFNFCRGREGPRGTAAGSHWTSGRKETWFSDCSAGQRSATSNCGRRSSRRSPTRTRKGSQAISPGLCSGAPSGRHDRRRPCKTVRPPRIGGATGLNSPVRIAAPALREATIPHV